MNKEITISNLLKSVENNEAPKKIKWEKYVYNFNSVEKEYYRLSGTNEMYTLFYDIDKDLQPRYMKEILEITIEILDEANDEFEDIKEYELCETVRKDDAAYKMNQLIRNQKKIIERLNKND